MINFLLILGLHCPLFLKGKGEYLRLCKGQCGKFLTNDIIANPYHALEFKDTGYCVDCHRITEIIENLKKSMETYEHLKKYAPIPSKSTKSKRKIRVNRAKNENKK